MGTLRASLAALAAGMLVAGCSADLTSVRYQNGASLPTNAIPYAIPKATISVTTTYTLSACDAKAQKLTIAASSALASTLSADDAMRFYVDYGAMRGPLKDVSVDLNLYPQGTLKGLNATGTSEALTTAATAVGVAFSGAVALTGAAVHEFAENVAPPPPPPFCNDDTMTLLDALTSAKNTQTQAKQKLSTDQKALANDVAKLPAGDDQIKTDQALVNQDNVSVTNANDAVTAAQAKLAIVTVQSVTPDASQFATIAGFSGSVAEYDLSARPVVSAWLTAAGVAFYVAQNPTTDVLRQSLAVVLDGPIAGAGDGGLPAIDGTTHLSPAISGLAVRFPVLAHIEVCGGPCPPPQAVRVVVVPKQSAEDDVQPITSRTAAPIDVMVPQLGPVSILALKGSAIQSSALNVSIAADGTVAEVKATDSSTATQILNTISSAFTTLATQNNAATAAQAQLLTAKNGAITAQASALTSQTGATTAATTASATSADNALKAQADCLSQLKTITGLGAVPVVTCP